MKEGFAFTLIPSAETNYKFAWIIKELGRLEREARSNERLKPKRSEISQIYNEAHKHAQALAIIDFIKSEQKSLTWSVSLFEVHQNYYEPIFRSVTDLLAELKNLKNAKPDLN